MQGRDGDLDLLIGAALSAGPVALSYWKKAPKSWEKPDDAGPVSEADLAVNDTLSRILRGARPSYGWLSEESPDSAERLSRSHVFSIDPIDGTRAFLSGEPHFSISLGVTSGGVAQAAVVYLPALDRLYAAKRGGIATCNGRQIGVKTGDVACMDVTILTGKPSLSPDHWRAPPEFQRHFRASMAYRLCLVAEGAFDGMLTFRPTWEWDVVAGALIAETAGANVTEAKGGALRFNQPVPKSAGILAAGQRVHSDLVTKMR